MRHYNFSHFYHLASLDAWVILHKPIIDSLNVKLWIFGSIAYLQWVYLQYTKHMEYLHLKNIDWDVEKNVHYHPEFDFGSSPVVFYPDGYRHLISTRLVTEYFDKYSVLSPYLKWRVNVKTTGFNYSSSNLFGLCLYHLGKWQNKLSAD